MTSSAPATQHVKRIARQVAGLMPGKLPAGGLWASIAGTGPGQRLEQKSPNRYPASSSEGCMSLELLNTLGTLATFVVIAATAIAAIVQLRHARSSNHITALNEMRETRETLHFQEANQFVAGRLSERLQDPAPQGHLSRRDAPHRTQGRVVGSRRAVCCILAEKIVAARRNVDEAGDRAP